MGQQIKSALLQSIHRIVLVLVSFLPGVLAFLLAVLIFTLIGFAVAALVRRLLVSLKFDERLTSQESLGSPARLADWSPSHSPTLLLTRIALWGCILIGAAVGISAFNASYSADSQFSTLLLPYFTHATGAILILLAGSLIARFLARSVLIGAVNAQLHYARFLSLGIKWLVLTLAAAMALDHVQIGGVVVELAFGILFGGIVLTLSLAIGLGSRDLVTRSIEKTLDMNPAKPSPTPGPTEVTSAPNPDTTPRPKLRHF
jgi:hypothetical protein